MLCLVERLLRSKRCLPGVQSEGPRIGTTSRTKLKLTVRPALSTPIYSVATAAISWGSFLFLMPHFVGGGVLLWASLCKKCWVRGMSGTSGLVVQGLFGGLFFLVAAFVIAKDSLATLKCRRLLGTSEVKTVTGPLVVMERFRKPGYGHVRFSIDGHALHTYTQGLGCDCGFIMPVGRSVKLIDDQPVRVQVSGDRVLSLERIE
jgi:hypothetical protein